MIWWCHWEKHSNNDNQHQSQAPWENICAQFPNKDSLIFMVGILILNISCSCAVMACVIFCNDQSRRFHLKFPSIFKYYGKNCYQDVDGLVQERCNSSALAMELRLSWTNPSVDGSVNGSVQKRRNSIANALELRLSYTNPSMCACSGWCLLLDFMALHQQLSDWAVSMTTLWMKKSINVKVLKHDLGRNCMTYSLH